MSFSTINATFRYAEEDKEEEEGQPRFQGAAAFEAQSTKTAAAAEKRVDRRRRRHQKAIGIPD